MADRSVATTDTFNDFRREVNGTARDIGDISDLLSASGYIASSTDVVEAIVAINALHHCQTSKIRSPNL